MQVTFATTILGFGNHAAIEIPDEQLALLGGNRRAPLKVTVNGYTYQSTATGMDGRCLVVFPTRDRDAANAQAGDKLEVTLALDSGYRGVELPDELSQALATHNLSEAFATLTYSRRKEYARQVATAAQAETKARRVAKIITELQNA